MSGFYHSENISSVVHMYHTNVVAFSFSKYVIYKITSLDEFTIHKARRIH